MGNLQLSYIGNRVKNKVNNLHNTYYKCYILTNESLICEFNVTIVCI